MLYIIRPDNDVLRTVINALGELRDDKTYTVKIELKTEKRSLQQNAYMHKLVGLICNFTGDSKKDIKRRVAWSCDIKEVFKTDDGYQLMPKPTSDMTVAELSTMIEALQVMCMALEIKFPRPEHYGYEL